MKRTEKKQEVTIVGQEEVPVQAEQQAAPVKPDISFDQWWAQAQNQYKFKPALKKAVECHFKARGFMESKDFEKGLRDFGYKV